MDTKYDHTKIEKQIYKKWESADVFSPEGSTKQRVSQGITGNEKPYSVLMPPPNANASLHCGHVTYVIQDIMARFKRMQGFDSCYFPGIDHAGFETQYVYENKLKKEGKSRFDFDRETLYKNILDFVLENSSIAIGQFKRLGLSADWNRNTFTLDKNVVEQVYKTFEKMNNDGYVYREGYMVNYSTYYGTTFSDLETEYKDTVSPLYFVKYKIKNSDKTISIATVRPETIYADVAIAVNPDDKRYKDLVGLFAINPLNSRELPIIKDEYVDLNFGTGALKITPGHDLNDFKIGKKHNFEVISVIGLDGKMINTEKEIDGLYPKQARLKVAEILKNNNGLEKVNEKYENRVLVDYKDGYPIEPLVMTNWFIKTEKLFDKVINSVENEEVKFYKPVWKKEILRWLNEKRPWPISRQIAFGIAIPAWYSIKENPEIFVTFVVDGKTISGYIKDIKKNYDIEIIKKGLQKIVAPENAKFKIQVESPGEDYLQETDTFDTWFSSGQWPQVTTGFPNSADYNKYYPTNFLDSMWDIMFFWIARMLMFGIYLTDKVPFKNVYFHGAVTDKHGVKMSKSKGNVINPIEIIDEYGADSLRAGIITGGDTSAKFTPLDIDKVKSYRNFSNKLWNIARFINMYEETNQIPNGIDLKEYEKIEINIVEESVLLTKFVTKKLEKYQYKLALEEIYHFVWDKLANEYLEIAKNKNDIDSMRVLKEIFKTSLKLLHPFMPFVTEAIWQELHGNKNSMLIVEKWPE
ncbi:MAG: valine--tRNA ligase [bacterium]|nr:valine--tRNA ligase [bacterium]